MATTLHRNSESQQLAAIGHPGYSNSFAYAVLLHMEREGDEAPQAIAACLAERRHQAIVNRGAMRINPACPFPFTR